MKEKLMEDKKMHKIYSKINPDKLLHLVVNLSDFNQERMDLIPDNQFIQCSTLKMQNNKTFRPHKHIWKDGPKKVIAQESWVVIQGKVKCSFFDIDNQLLCEYILEAGDASFTLEGGHTYTILSDDTLIYEYKTGPYEGQKMDKEFI